MKWLIACSLAFAGLMSAAPAAAQAGWRVATYGGSNSNRSVYLVDSYHIDRKGMVIRFWTQTVFEQMTYEDRDWDHSVTYREGNCSEYSSAVIQNSFYQGEKLLETDTTRGKAVIHSPDSIMRGVLELLCDGGDYQSALLANPARDGRTWLRNIPFD